MSEHVRNVKENEVKNRESILGLSLISASVILLFCQSFINADALSASVIALMGIGAGSWYVGNKAIAIRSFMLLFVVMWYLMFDITFYDSKLSEPHLFIATITTLICMSVVFANIRKGIERYWKMVSMLDNEKKA